MGKKQILNKLPNQNHEFLEGDVPYTLNPGGPNHEELSCLVGVCMSILITYMNTTSLEKPNNCSRSKIEKVNDLIAISMNRR